MASGASGATAISFSSAPIFFVSLITALFSVLGLPADGTSVARYVRAAVEEIRASGLRHEIHASGTEVECARLGQLLRLVGRVDAAVARAGARRITILVKIDDRRDARAGLRAKVRSATRRPVRT